MDWSCRYPFLGEEVVNNAYCRLSVLDLNPALSAIL